MPVMPSGINWVAGGATAAILLPLLAIGADMPFWIACILSATAGGGVVALLTPRKLFEHLDSSGAARGKIEFARELMTDAEPIAARLDVAATSIRTPEAAERVRHLASLTREIFAAIEKDPLRIDRVRRFLTYYLPRAAEIAEAYALLERARALNGARLKATGDLIDRLDVAFTHYAATLQDADLDNLDIELKLLKSSLDSDLGPAQGAVVPLDPGKRRA